MNRETVARAPAPPGVEAVLRGRQGGAGADGGRAGGLGDKASPTLHLQEGMFWFQTGRVTQVLVNLAAVGR
ncbi:hypothetical protein [Nonomuraea sp. NPDC049784]|uniref:hypothetical protein n=1 Tax=Nonomuraea sp. NPDC049784 TaxID=3154361 RepID=UPI0034078CCB